MKNKKILFIVTQSEFGGAQRFIYNLIKGLRRYTRIESRQVGNTRIHAEENRLLYSDISYKIRGACFKIWEQFRGAFKEKIIENSLKKELISRGLRVDTQKQISVMYKDEKVGTYIPDMIIDDKVLVELKSKTFLTKEDEKQFWLYLKGSDYRLGLLVNFGKKLEIKRKVYDTARNISASISVSPKAQDQRISVSIQDQRVSANYEIVVAAGPEGDNANGLLFNLKNSGFKTINLKFLRRKINPIFDIRGLIEIYRILKIEKPNILFLCSTKAGVLGSVASYFYSKFQRKSAYSSEARQDQRVSAKSPKVIYRIGGWSFNDPWPNWKKRLYVWIEKISGKWKDVIINNAESDRQQAIKLGIKPKDKIVTIYNGIGDLEFLSKEKAKSLLKLSFNRLIVGTIANDYPTKGLKYLKKAMEQIDGELVIIGKGNTYIPDAYKYLKAFDIFVLPSVKEGFPWTILEAMAAEVPIIATKVGAIPEVIENGKNGILIEPARPNEISDAIIKLIKNQKLKEEIVRNAKNTVIEKFSLEKMIKKYEDLLLID